TGSPEPPRKEGAVCPPGLSPAVESPLLVAAAPGLTAEMPLCCFALHGLVMVQAIAAVVATVAACGSAASAGQVPGGQSACRALINRRTCSRTQAARLAAKAFASQEGGCVGA